MRTCHFAAAACLLPLALVSALAQTPDAPPVVTPDTRTSVARLVGDILINGKNFEYDRQLADTIGPRLTGSANYEAAVVWAQQKLRAAGATNVHTEPFTMPATWEPDTPAQGKMTAPREQQLHIYSAGWSPSTPDGGVQGSVYYVEHLLPADKLDAAAIKGAVVMVDRASLAPADGGAMQIGDLFAAIDKLAQLGAVGVIYPGSANGTQNASAFTLSGKISPLPIAQLGEEDALLIKRLLAAGPVAVEFSFKNRIREQVATENVVGEIRGSEFPDQVVIVGGHLDSWHPGTGAQDNGTGATTAIEIARAVRQIDRPPLRTMRFVLFGGEEEGLIGSNAYATAHKDEAAKIDAVIISDTGSEPAKGFYLMGRNDEKVALAEYEPLEAGLGGDQTTDNVDFMFASDHAGFELLGVPELVLWTDTDKYWKLHHQASDTFDSVSQKDFTQGVCVTAVMAYAIADSAQPFAKHLSPDEVTQMLKDAKKYDEYQGLKKAGMVE